ncbi:MAG TPA: hypothetical protein PKY30_17750, partial [Myxococcota bacterium]|nr:hypothetical protein [Myxococcota bacterium]
MLFLLLLACHDLRVDAKEPVDVDNSSDPNGTDSTSPNASPEVCDDRDNDGDGVVDEDAADAPTWYLDADDDGYG